MIGLCVILGCLIAVALFGAGYMVGYLQAMLLRLHYCLERKHYQND